MRLLGVSQPAAHAAMNAAAEGDRRVGVSLADAGVVAPSDGALVDALAHELIRFCYHDLSQAFSLFGGLEEASALIGRPIDLKRASEADTKRMADGDAGVPGSPGWHVTLEELPGRYTHASDHARGGMGRVLIVNDTNMGREVALKELLPPSEASTVGGGSPARTVAMMASRFLQEARITARLEHPSIVPVYELGRRRNGTLYYTMKLVRGETLAQRLSKAETLSDRLALLPHVLDLCQAVAYAHARGVIHRDLKPSNVMVGEFGETVLLDWGIARVRSEPDPFADDIVETTAAMLEGLTTPPQTAFGAAVGTPHYMAPEQAAGRLDLIDERSDVYGLGAILYEILTGAVPFHGATVHAVLRRVADDTPPTVIERAPDVPPDLASICQKAMARRREARYGSAMEMAQDIQRFQAGLLVQAYAYRPWQTLTRLYRRYRTPVNIAAAGVAAVILIGIVSYIQVWQANIRERAQRTAADHASYAATMQLAGLHAQDGRFRESLIGMLDTPEALRGWEWGHLYGETQRHRYELGPHPGFVYRAVFLPGGERVLTLSTDQALRVWDWKNESLLFTHETTPELLRDVEPAPDGGTFAVSLGNGMVQILDAATGAELARHQAHRGFVNNVAFDAAGQRVVTAGTDGRVKVWTWPAFDPLAEFRAPCPAVSQGGISADGRFAVGRCDNGPIRAWNIDTGEVVAESTGTRMAMHPSEPWLLVHGDRTAVYDLSRGSMRWSAPAEGGSGTRARFSSTGRFVTTQAGDAGVRVFESATGNIAATLSLGAIATDFATDPEERLVAAVGRNGVAKVWEIASGEERNRVAGHHGTVTGVSLHPSESLVMTNGTDGTARIWNWHDERRLYTVATDRGPLVDATPDAAGRVVALAGAGPGLTVIDREVGAAVLHADAPGTSFYRRAVMSPAGDRVLFAADGHTPLMLSLPEGALVARLDELAGPVGSMAFSADGATVATAGWEHRVYLADAATGEAQLVLEAGRRIDSLGFVPGSTRLAALDQAGTVTLWDAASGERLQQLHAGSPARRMIIDSAGQRLAVLREDGEIVLWKLATPDAPRLMTQQADAPELPRGQRDTFVGGAFFADPPRLLALDYRGTLTAWDLAFDRPVVRLDTGAGFVQAAAYLAADDALLLAASSGEVRVLASAPPTVSGLGAPAGTPYIEAFAAYRRAQRDAPFVPTRDNDPIRVAWLAPEEPHQATVASFSPEALSPGRVMSPADMRAGAWLLGLRPGDRIVARALPGSVTVMRDGRETVIEQRRVPVITEVDERTVSAADAAEQLTVIRGFFEQSWHAVQTVNAEIAKRRGLAPPPDDALDGLWIIGTTDGSDYRFYSHFGLADRDRITHVDSVPLTSRDQWFAWLDHALAYAESPPGIPLRLRIERGSYRVVELAITLEE